MNANELANQLLFIPMMNEYEKQECGQEAAAMLRQQQETIERNRFNIESLEFKIAELEKINNSLTNQLTHLYRQHGFTGVQDK